MLSALSRFFKIDRATKSQVTIDYPHHEAHEGKFYSVHYADLSMASGDKIILAFKTMLLPEVAHLLIEFSTLLGGKFHLDEGPTWVAETGGVVEIQNRWRKPSMRSSGLLENQAQAGFVASDQMIVNPSNFVSGKELFPDEAFGSSVKVAVGGRSENEAILWPEKTYALVFESSAANNKGQIKAHWYENGC